MSPNRPIARGDSRLPTSSPGPPSQQSAPRRLEVSYVGVESGRPRPKRKPGLMVIGGALVVVLLLAVAWKHGPTRAGTAAGGLPGTATPSTASSSKADALPPHALPGGAKPPPDHHDFADESAVKAREEAREAERKEREKKKDGAAAAAAAAGAVAANPLPASSSSASASASASASSCSLQEEPWLRDSKTLVPAESNGQPSAEACREACAATAGCNAWTWCFDGNGCPLLRGALAPSLGCELSREPLRPRGATAPGTVTHYGASCYISGYVRERQPGQETFVRLHSSPAQPRVLVVTEVPSRDQGCAYRGGTEAMLRHVLNKQDYARWHSYEFSLISEPLDDDLHPRGGSAGGQWNKVAALSRMLQETPMRRNAQQHHQQQRHGEQQQQHEEEEEEEDSWILYQFFDAMIDDVGFTFPFESYAGKDLIVVGDAAKVAAGDPSSLDTGALLLRNSRWARSFIRRLETAIVDSDQPAPEVAATTDLVAKAITSLLSSNPDSDLSRVRFETDFCVNCDWRRIDLAASGGSMSKTAAWGDANKNWKLFTTRFFDCQLCSGHGVDEATLAKCDAAHRAHYEFAYCRFARNAAAAAAGALKGSPLEQIDAKHPQTPPELAARGLEQPPLYDFAAFKAKGLPKVKNAVLRAAASHRTSTGDECQRSCLAEPRCEFWVWCRSRGGCDDGGDWDVGRFPHLGCELMEFPKSSKHLEPPQWDRGPAFSSFESGYISADRPRDPRDPHAVDRVVLLTGISGTPCNTPWGDYLLEVQLRNKADWARLHGYELHQMAETRDPKIRPGAWQKLALLRGALKEIPPSRAEWLLWMDMDVIINDPITTFPLDWYEKHDLVMWGDAAKVRLGDVSGMNSGVLLLRNGPWAAALLDEVAKYAGYPVDTALEQRLASQLTSYDVGMYEQNPLTLLFKTRPDEFLGAHVRWEDALTMNVWYKKRFEPDVPQPPFVVHFAGCQLCNGFHPEKLGECDGLFLGHYAESVARLDRAMRDRGGKVGR